MKRRRQPVTWLAVLCWLAVAGLWPVAAQGGGQPAANIVEGCAETYDPAVNYFPEQVAFTYAGGVEVEYFNNYKVVTVTRPWPGAAEADAFRYVLVQCGTPAPEGFPGATVIEVPIRRTITISTTQLPHIVALGALDALVGVGTIAYVNASEVVEKYEAGELIEIGDAFDPSMVNIELVLDAEPDVVMAYGSGFPDYDAYPHLVEAGIPVAMNADHAEASPLGRAEWIKFTALFFNREAAANEVFDGIVQTYQELAALTADIPEADKPLVLLNSYNTWSEAWALPGSATFVGQLMRDAGARLVLGDDPMVVGNDGSALFDFEVVYEAGLEADIWIPVALGWSTLDDVLAADERYADLAAFQSGRVYNNNARENPNGGNDWYESGVLRPDLILADLITIFHPDLLPDHELYYYRQLGPAGE